jgi:hypothetical protein
MFGSILAAWLADSPSPVTMMISTPSGEFHAVGSPTWVGPALEGIHGGERVPRAFMISFPKGKVDFNALAKAVVREPKAITNLGCA